MRAGGALLPGAAVSGGRRVPADGPWAALRLPPGVVGAFLPGLAGCAAARGRHERQLRGLSLPPRGHLQPRGPSALLPLRVRAGLGRDALRGVGRGA